MQCLQQKRASLPRLRRAAFADWTPLPIGAHNPEMKGNISSGLGQRLRESRSPERDPAPAPAAVHPSRSPLLWNNRPPMHWLRPPCRLFPAALLRVPGPVRVGPLLRGSHTPPPDGSLHTPPHGVEPREGQCGGCSSPSPSQWDQLPPSNYTFKTRGKYLVAWDHRTTGRSEEARARRPPGHTVARSRWRRRRHTDSTLPSHPSASERQTQLHGASTSERLLGQTSSDAHDPGRPWEVLASGRLCRSQGRRTGTSQETTDRPGGGDERGIGAVIPAD